MISTDVSSALADFLTKQAEKDSMFITTLVNHRILVNNEDLDVVCPFDPQGINRASAVGVLNGFLDSIGQPRVMFTEEDDGRISKFTPVVTPTWHAFEVCGMELKIGSGVPQVEIDRIKQAMEDVVNSCEEKILLVNCRAEITQLPEGVNFMLVSAPDIPVQELAALRDHIYQAFHDPDYTVATNYEVNISPRAKSRT